MSGSRFRSRCTAVTAAVVTVAAGWAGTVPAGATGVARCTADQLSVQVGGDRSVGTAGRDYTFLEIVDGSAASCSLAGYPAVQILDRSGERVSGPVRQRPRPAPATVVLNPGSGAEIEIHDRYTPRAACQGDIDGSAVLTFPGVAPLTVAGYGYSACALSVTAVHPPRDHPVGA